MPVQIKNTLTATITSENLSLNKEPVSFDIGNPSWPCTFARYNGVMELQAGANVLSLTQQVTTTGAVHLYIKNVDQNGATVTVQWVPLPVGNPNVQIITLFPGDLIIVWQQVTNVLNGIAQITLTPSQSPCSVEFFWGG